MKKIVLLGVIAVFALDAFADATDWMNFASGADKKSVVSVQFRTNGTLTFGDTEICYDDNDTHCTIPYENGAYIYFSPQSEAGVEEVIANSGLLLVYDINGEQIELRGANGATQISLISTQGVLLSTTNANVISTKDLQRGLVIAVAVNNGTSITQKFILR